LGHGTISILGPGIWCPTEQKSYASSERIGKRLEKYKEGSPASLEKFSNRRQMQNHRKRKHELAIRQLIVLAPNSNVAGKDHSWMGLGYNSLKPLEQLRVKGCIRSHRSLFVEFHSKYCSNAKQGVGPINHSKAPSSLNIVPKIAVPHLDKT